MKRAVMGLLLLAGSWMASAEPVDWKAHWIWIQGEPKPKNFYLYTRKVIDVPADLTKARAMVSADSRYQLFVNSEWVGRGPARSDPRWQSYDVYDLSKRLKPGRNVIAALVYHYGITMGAYIEGRGGFLFQMDGATRDGKPFEVVSDGSWKVKHADAWVQNTPRVNEPLGFIEVYDASREPVGWQTAGFDDSGWEQAVVVGIGGGQVPQGHLAWNLRTPRITRVPLAPWTSMVEREIPPLMEEERWPAKVVSYGNVERNGIFRGVMLDMDPLDIATEMSMEPPAPLKVGRVVDPENALRRDGKYTIIQNNSEPEGAIGLRDIYMLIDFGTIMAGRIRITVDGVKGGVVDFGYAERLTDGRLIANMGQRYADRYIMRDGPQTWEAFHWKGFRYVQLTFRNCYRPVKLDSVSINFTSYPVGHRGQFESSDELLNKIWKAGAYTMRLNMQDAFMDCIFREQRQWVEDARPEILVNFYAFGVTKLPARYLKYISYSQQPDGLLSSYYPGPVEVVADDCLEWLMSLRDYYMFTGDIGMVRRMYPVVTRLLEGLKIYINRDNLIGELPFHIFFDWVPNDYAGETAGMNADMYGGLRIGADMARLMGENARAQEYDQQAERIKAAVNRLLWSAREGAYADSRHTDGELSSKISQNINGMVMFQGIAPKERVARIVPRILDESRTIEATPFGMGYLLPAMFANGYGKEALKIIRDKYGFMIRQGSTTIWEYWRYDGDQRSGRWTAFPRAMAHAWGTIPTYQLSRSILGVAALKPGFTEFEIAPDPVDLQWARGVVPSPPGDIGVDWKVAAGGLMMKVTVPERTTAEVALPDSAGKSVTMNGEGIWAQGKMTGRAAGMEDVRLADGRVRVRVRAGRYEFVVR